MKEEKNTEVQRANVLETVTQEKYTYFYDNGKARDCDIVVTLQVGHLTLRFHAYAGVQ